MPEKPNSVYDLIKNTNGTTLDVINKIIEQIYEIVKEWNLFFKNNKLIQSTDLKSLY